MRNLLTGIIIGLLLAAPLAFGQDDALTSSARQAGETLGAAIGGMLGFYLAWWLFTLVIYVLIAGFVISLGVRRGLKSFAAEAFGEPWWKVRSRLRAVLEEVAPEGGTAPGDAEDVVVLGGPSDVGGGTS